MRKQHSESSSEFEPLPVPDWLICLELSGNHHRNLIKSDRPNNYPEK